MKTIHGLCPRWIPTNVILALLKICPDSLYCSKSILSMSVVQELKGVSWTEVDNTYHHGDIMFRGSLGDSWRICWLWGNVLIWGHSAVFQNSTPLQECLTSTLTCFWNRPLRFGKNDCLQVNEVDVKMALTDRDGEFQNHWGEVVHTITKDKLDTYNITGSKSEKPTREFGDGISRDKIGRQLMRIMFYLHN